MDQSDKIVIAKLKKIAIISLVFMTIQIVGGALAHSIAIMADAFHLLSDVIAYVISLYAVLLSNRLAPKHLAFGYEKAQPLGALINVAIIWCVTIQLFIEATHRIIEKQVVQQPLYMLLTSFFGLGCNLYIMKTLHSEEGGHDHHGHSHGHSHGHDHGGNELNEEHHDDSRQCGDDKDSIEAVCSCNSPDQINRSTKGTFDGRNTSVKEFDSKELESPIPMQLNEGLVPKKSGYCVLHTGQKHSHDHHGHDHDHQDHHDHGHGGCSHGHSHHKVFENINIQAAYIHIISDIILSIGVIISASVIYFVAGNDTEWSAWQLADPFCTYLFSIVALYSTISIVKESIVILMDGCENPSLLVKTDQFVRILKKDHPYIEVDGIRVWSSNRGKYYCTMRITMNKNTPSVGELSEEKQLLKQNDVQEVIYNKVKAFCKSKKMTVYIDISRN